MKKLSFLIIVFLSISTSGICQNYINGGFLPDTIKNNEPLNFSNNTSAELVDKIYPPSDFEGMPLDIEKVGGNIFVFTDKKLLHFDDQFSPINNVDISNKAFQYRNVVSTREFSSSNKNLAYSSHTNELFVVNNDGEIGYYDLDEHTYNPLALHSISSVDIPINKILIDEQNERVVWKCKIDDNTSTIKVLDLNTKNLIATRDFSYPIHDICFDNAKNLIAKSTTSLRKLNANLQTIAINTNLYGGYSVLYIPDQDEIVSFNGNSITKHDNSLNILNTISVSSRDVISYKYLPQESAVFFTYKESSNSNYRYYTKLDLIQNTVESGEFLLGATGIDELSNGNIIVSGFNSLIEVDPATLSEINEFDFSASLNKFSVASGGLYSISTHGGIAAHFDNGLQLLDYKNIGANMNEGCLNPENGKVYYIHSNTRNDYSSVYIYDENNNLLNSIDLDSRLQSIEYHEGDIYVTSDFSETLYVIDGDFDQLNNSLSIPASSSMDDIYTSEEYLYIVGSSSITVVKNAQIIDTFTVSGVDFSDFSFDDVNQKAYFLTGNATGSNVSSEIYEVDENTLSMQEIYSMNSDGAQFLYVNPVLQRIYVAATSTGASQYIKILDQNSLSLIHEKNVPGAVFRGFEYNPVNNDLYLLDSQYPVHLFTINSADEILQKKLNIYHPVYSYMYNPVNNNLYIYSKKWDNNEADDELRLYEYSCTNHDFKGYIDFEEFFKPTYFRLFPPDNMVLNPSTNQLYVGNNTFSNACVVQCPPMERKFETGWTWASFPTLERQNDDPIQAIPFLETLEPMPSSMEFWHLSHSSEYEDNNWAPQDVTEIQSSKGYKLNNLGSSEAYLETPGTTLNEDHAISLTTGENWIGYFPMEPRKALDALEGVLDDLDMIKTQDWGCYKEYIAEKGGTVPTWVCAVGKEGFTALTHGDMVVVNATDPTTLVWNQDAPPVSKKDAEETQQYSYTELADYQSIFIEADPEQIDEIGAFVNDECIGATVVNDTLEEIKAYIPADATGDITLEYYSEGTKSTTKLAEYTILYPETKVDGIIKARNKDRYYRVSLKNTLGVDENNPNHHNNLQVFPNPSGGLVTFSLSTNQKIKGTLDVYNSTGVHIKQLLKGAIEKGTHTFYLNKAGELPAGVYLYTFKTGSTIKNGKIVIQ